jgi:hypothetical protein
MRRRKTNLLLLAGWADRCGRLVTPHLGLSRREDAAHGPFSLFFSFFGYFAAKSWRAGTTAFIYSVCTASGIKYAPCTQHSRLDSILRCAPASQLRLPCLLVSSQAGSSGTRAVFPLTAFPSPAGDAASGRDREREEREGSDGGAANAARLPRPEPRLRPTSTKQRKKAPRSLSHTHQNAPRPKFGPKTKSDADCRQTPFGRIGVAGSFRGRISARRRTPKATVGAERGRLIFACAVAGVTRLLPVPWHCYAGV